jgi:hypothetical protein
MPSPRNTHKRPMACTQLRAGSLAVKNPSYAVMHSFACKQRAGTAASHKKRARSGRYHAASERRDRGAHTGGCAWPCGVRPKPARQPPRESFCAQQGMQRFKTSTRSHACGRQRRAGWAGRAPRGMGCTRRSPSGSVAAKNSPAPTTARSASRPASPCAPGTPAVLARLRETC